MMISGSNSVFQHDGKEYHIQAEDLGDEAGVFEVRVYLGGGVVWLKRISHADLVEQDVGKVEYEKTLRSRMEKMILTVEAAIAKGKIG